MIRDAFTRAWMMNVETSDSGHLQVNLETSGNIVRVSEDDGVYRVYLFDSYEVELGEVSISGRLANVRSLSAIISAASNS